MYNDAPGFRTRPACECSYGRVEEREEDTTEQEEEEEEEEEE